MQSPRQRSHPHAEAGATPCRCRDWTDVRLSMNVLIQMEKRIVGCIFGSVNSRADIPALIRAYEEGTLDLDGMITREYPLDGVNQGYHDMHAGRNIRGILRLG